MDAMQEKDWNDAGKKLEAHEQAGKEPGPQTPRANLLLTSRHILAVVEDVEEVQRRVAGGLTVGASHPFRAFIAAEDGKEVLVNAREVVLVSAVPTLGEKTRASVLRQTVASALTMRAYLEGVKDLLDPEVVKSVTARFDADLSILQEVFKMEFVAEEVKKP